MQAGASSLRAPRRLLSTDTRQSVRRIARALAMENRRWRAATIAMSICSALTILCCMCDHGSFRPGRGAWFRNSRSTAATHGRSNTTEFDVHNRTIPRSSWFGVANPLTVGRRLTTTDDQTKLISSHDYGRRLGSLIPPSEGWMPYILVCIGSASMVAAVYGGNFGRRQWRDSDHTTSRRAPPAWGPHMTDYPLREWIRDLLDWVTLCVRP